MNISKWQAFAEKEWNDKADNWVENSAAMWEKGNRKDIMPFFLKHLLRGEDVLDIGCAGGYSTNKLYQSGMKAEGVDLSGDMIQTAKADYSHISFQKGDIVALPHKDESFDSALVINVMEWLEVPVVGLHELRRILREKGRLCVGILGPTAAPRQNGYRRLYGDQTMMNTMQPWEFEQLAQENGFRVLDYLPVEKKWEVQEFFDLPVQAQQTLSFMWVFILEKQTGDEK